MVVFQLKPSHTCIEKVFRSYQCWSIAGENGEFEATTGAYAVNPRVTIPVATLMSQ
jgi:hypothetical protein